MKMIMRILKALFILTIIINSLNVYATNLIHRAYSSTLGGTDIYSLKIKNMTAASQGSIDTYEDPTTTKNSLGWVIVNTNDYSLDGGPTSFDAKMYVFAPYAKFFTSYNSGFDESVDNITNNNIYYDSYNGIIDEWSDNLNNFQKVPANIPENQTSLNTEGYLSMSRKSSKVQLVAWKVVNKVRLDVWNLTDEAVKEILNDSHLKDEKFDTDGIRFSSVLSTTAETYWNHEISNSYVDTAWKFFQGSVDNGWSSAGRGFKEEWTTPHANDTGTYKPGASVANEFDNILLLPVKKSKREIYIRHVDESGKVIDGLQNQNIKMISPPGPVKPNLGATSGYQEHYTISGDEKVEIRKSDQTVGTDGITYTFERGTSSSGIDIPTAQAWHGKYTWLTATTEVIINTLNKDDVLVIDLVYSKPPIVVTQSLPKFEIIGKLCFINTHSPYVNSTSGNDIDYIPSTKTLTPYVEGAYPYTVRALSYEPNNETNTASATITYSINYSWDYTYEVCDDADPTDCECKDGSDSDTITRSYTYTVPYKHTWFHITNFKMYRISKLEVYDNVSNIGGVLFGGETYRIDPSTSYEGKFSGGKTNKTLKITFPSSSYSLDPIHKEAPEGCDKSGESAALAAATTAMNNVWPKDAADHQNLTITYEYDNDYVKLDGTTDMLRQNYKTWSERIILISDATNVRDLDSTKEGPGKINGAPIDYTTNLMTFMRPPTTRRTSNEDFEEAYKQVPIERENGIRWLKGKIYYEISTDPNYNVGSDNFISTDATYTLNNPISVTNNDFIVETKEYKGSDVNRVNVFTPMRFGDFQVVTAEIVDHTTGAGKSTVLQKNAEFKITPNTLGSSEANYSNVDTREFIKGYYFIFDFNIEIDNDGDGVYEEPVEAHTTIYRPGNHITLTAKTTDSYDSGSASQIKNKVKVVAISTNITDKLDEKMKNMTMSYYKYMEDMYNLYSISGKQNQPENKNLPDLLTRRDIISDSYHAIYKILTTKNIGRIFDFAVTDCTDLEFKNVFRLSNEDNIENNINETASVAYYSGYKYWNLYSSDYNEMVNRPDDIIKSNPQKTLPLGPYKNKNIKYVNAPKMGYRISFDLKTTGYIANNNKTDTRKVVITPNYYYISKDGITFDNDVALYYKNSSNNYVNFANSAYIIYFKPNDGYRYLRNSIYTDVYDTMSKKLEPLSISNTITLTSKMMATNNTSFIQSWYGEYKLPNSTIVKSNVVGNVHNNINNPYKDGYIGVRFDIKSIDSAGETIMYDTKDKSANTPNTSQWDYEGFMNFKTPGSLIDASNPLRYQLEKDAWVIDNAMYQKIKGTVVLFDLDNRAANDFE